MCVCVCVLVSGRCGIFNVGIMVCVWGWALFG